MNAFVKLPIEDQASLVLVTLLEDVAHKSRSFASIEHAVAQLFGCLGAHFDVPQQEVRIVAEAVANRGIRMLPAYPLEALANDTPEVS